MSVKTSKRPLDVLGVDIGGSGVKAALISPEGRMMPARVRIPTPQPSTPAAVVATIQKLTQSLPAFDRVAVGFPGLVREGIVYAAPNLGNDHWRGFPLGRRLQKTLGKPVRLINDAEMQGLAVIGGKGMELVLTLGTGCGIAVFWNGRPIPHLELSQHPLRKGKNYDQYVGDKVRRKMTKKKWTRRVNRVLATLKTVVNFDRVYVGGGNAKKKSGSLDFKAKVVQNKAGLIGGAALWRFEDWS